MKRIDDRTVEFTTDLEEWTYIVFHRFLDEGHTIDEAITKLRRINSTASLTEEFWQYLAS